MGSESALEWVSRLIGVALVLTSIEHLRLRRATSSVGVWAWRIVRRELEELPAPLRTAGDRLLGRTGLRWLLYLRLVAAGWLIVSPAPVPLAIGFATTLLLAIRFRGAFNGGSDSMTLIVLGSAFVASLGAPDSVPSKVGLWYLGIQVVASYFIAGVAKLGHRSWRTGRALSAFLSTAVYEPPASVISLLSRRGPGLLAGWAVLLFELGFPVSLVHPYACVGLVALAVPFHLTNFWLFGLNRFVFAWLAAYPALYWCATSGL